MLLFEHNLLNRTNTHYPSKLRLPYILKLSNTRLKKRQPQKQDQQNQSLRVYPICQFESRNLFFQMISNKASSPGSAQSVVSYDVRRKLDSLFFTWMSDKTTQNRIRELIGNNNDTTLTADSNSDISFTQPSPPLSPKSTKNKKSFKKTTSPLRSPRSPPPRSPKGNKNTTSSSASTKTVSPSSSPLKKESSATSNELPRTSLDEFKLDNHPPQAPSSPPATTTSETKTDASILNKTDEAIKNEATAPTAPATSLIKTFWVPNEGGRGRGKRLIRDTLSNRAAEITTLFAEYPKGMSHENFVAVTKDLCNLPSFFSTPLHIRVRYLWLEKIETEMKNGTETKSSESKTKKMDAKMFKKMKKELMMEEGLGEFFFCLKNEESVL